MTLNELMIKQNFISKALLKDGDSELSKSFDRYFFEKNTTETLKLIEKAHREDWFSCR